MPSDYLSDSDTPNRGAWKEDTDPEIQNQTPADKEVTFEPSVSPQLRASGSLALIPGDLWSGRQSQDAASQRRGVKLNDPVRTCSPPQQGV